MAEISKFVACGSPHWVHEEEWRGFKIVSCKECGLSFTLNPNYKPERYASAYGGKGGLPVPQGHVYVYTFPFERLRLEATVFFIPPPRLTPAER